MDSTQESANDTTMESIDEVEEDMNQEKTEGTSYSFFPSKGGASSYSMSFSAAVVVTDEEDVAEAVNSWREGLEGDWNE